MRTARSIALSLLVPFVLSGCIARREPADTPTHAFDRLWRDFDEYYGLFEVKQVDWEALHALHRPRVHDAMSDADLYAVVVDLLSELDDKHVTLYPATNPELPNFAVDLVNGAFPAPPFDPEVVRASYLSGAASPHPAITYGFLSPTLGYLHISSFDGTVDEFEGPLDDALRALGVVEGLVVDVRDNPGGFDPLAQYAAGRFADARRLYMTVRKRNGPAHADFGPAVAWYVEPSGSFQYIGPIVLLTTYATQSAGETFALAMRELPHVVHVGETTAGAFSDAILRETYNGWAYTISVGDYRAADGQSYEGVGLVPDVVDVNTEGELRMGIDRVLERGVEMLAP